MTDTTFAVRLKVLRERSGMTQQQLADRAGLTREGVAQLEIGRRRPTWETVQSLANALGVSCESFRDQPTNDDAPVKVDQQEEPALEDEKRKKR